MSLYTKTSLLRLPKVLVRTGLSESALRRLIRAGKFPKQVSIGPRTSAWSEEEVDGWISSQIAKRDEELAA